METPELENLLQQANKLLFEARSLRTRPTTDTKIITSWNALMLSAYATAYKAFGDQTYLDNALELKNFIQHKLMIDGALYHTFMEGSASTKAFLDDYALLSEALFRLYEITFDIEHLRLVEQLTHYVLHHFSDSNTPLFYFTSDESEALIARKHEFTDNVIPSSNSAMAHVLLTLGKLTGIRTYIQRAEMMLQSIGQRYVQGGAYFANWAMLAGRITYPSLEIVVTGPNALPTSLQLQQAYLPLAVFAGGDTEHLTILQDRTQQTATTIYVCRNEVCSLPVHSIEEAKELIKI